MKYTTIYDIAARGYEQGFWAYICSGLVVANLIVFFFFRSWQYRTGFLTVSCLVLAITFILPYWDYSRLKKKLVTNDCNKVEGVVTQYWEKKWRDKRADGKWQDYHYEGFTIGGVTFGYYIQGGGGAAGFENTAKPRFMFRDGMMMRVHYYAEPVITGGTVKNRILKLEVAQ